MNADAINQQIEKLCQYADRELIQKTAVDCLLHALRTGDVIVADRLLQAVKSGKWEWKRLSAWLTKYGPFNCEKAGEGRGSKVKVTHNPKAARDLKPNLQKADYRESLLMKAWWTCPPQKVAKPKEPFSLRSKLERLAEKAARQAPEDERPLLEDLHKILAPEGEGLVAA